MPEPALPPMLERPLESPADAVPPSDMSALLPAVPESPATLVLPELPPLLMAFDDESSPQPSAPHNAPTPTTRYR
jgi:hypothetical protein